MLGRTNALRILRLTFACALLLLAAAWIPARAQSLPSQPNPQPTPNDRRNDQVDFGSREFDARARLILKADKKAYEEHRERAREARDLAAELVRVYETTRVFNAADHKKLERLEKLTRRIRNQVGGSDDDAEAKDLPRTPEEGVPLLAAMAKELCDEVEKTPRRVVSATIINQANKLIALIQYVRGPRD